MQPKGFSTSRRAIQKTDRKRNGGESLEMTAERKKLWSAAGGEGVFMRGQECPRHTNNSTQKRKGDLAAALHET